MKKNLVLTLAATMLLASCGNNSKGNEAYVEEPETKSVIENKDAVKPLAALSTNLATKKAIGAQLNGNASANLKMTTLKNVEAGLDRDLVSTLNASIDDLKASAAIGGLGTAKPAAYIDLGAKLNAGYSVDKAGFDETAQKVTYNTVNAELKDASLNALYAIEDGVSYTSATGSVKAINEFIKKVSADFNLNLGLSVEETKTKENIDADTLADISTLGVMASGYVAQLASALNPSILDSLTPAASDEKSILDYFTFKEYTNGEYGLVANFDISVLIGSLMGEAKEAKRYARNAGEEDSEDYEGEEDWDYDYEESITGSLRSLLGSLLAGLKGSVKGTVIFTEQKIVSAGFDCDLSFVYDAGVEEEGLSMKIEAGLKAGAKVTFAYDDEVKVATVADKASYK